MIPILYERNTTDFTNNGIGRLSDAISCTVEEKESGVFECKLKYPITGIHYADIQEGRIVYAIHDDLKSPQPFEVYGRTAPINGIVTFFCHHVSYQLGNVVLDPFTASTCTEAFVKLKDKEINASPFSFWTDKAATGDFKITVPTVTRSILAGVEGSILDVFGGGDYEWDGYTVKLWNDRGQDNNVNIRYGVNLVDLVHDTDYSSAFNAVVPYWYQEDVDGEGSVLVTLPEKMLRAVGTEEQELKPISLDLTSVFNEQPTETQIRDYATRYLTNNKPWQVDESISVNFVALWQTEDYKNVAPLQRVRIYDYVHVVYEELGIDKKMQVVETVYNVLTEKYDRMELGVSKQSFADVVSAIADAKIKKETVSKSYVDASIARTADTIKGNRGGYKYEVTDADGHIMETLYMDSPNINTAVNILRIGQSGIAFSNHGYDPESFVTAWTIDGEFNANFIAAGKISANFIEGGTLKLGGANNVNGVLMVYNASGTEIGKWDRSGLSVTGAFEIIDKSLSITTDNGYESHSAGFVVSNANHIESDGLNATDGIRLICNVYADTYRYNSKKNFIYIESFSGSNSDYSYLIKDRIRYGRSPYAVKSDMDIIHTNSGHMEFGTYVDGQSTNRSSWLSFEDVGITMEVDANTTQGGSIDNLSATGLHIASAFRWSTPGEITLVSNSDNYIRLLASNTIPFRIEIDANNGYSTKGSLRYKKTDKNWYINGSVIQVVSSSSKRYKHSINDNISKELDAHKLYKLPMKQFVFNSDHNVQYADMKNQVIPGFIAEDVAEIYPPAVIHNGEGEIESWDERRIIPGMLKLIQEQHKDIEKLKGKIMKMEAFYESK